jgi:hypothetical protein
MTIISQISGKVSFRCNSLPSHLLSQPLALPVSPCLALSRPASHFLNLSHPVSPCLALSHPVPPCLTLSRPASLCLTLSHHVSPCLTMSRPVSPCLTLSHTVSPCLALPHPVSPCLTVSHPVSPCLTLSHPVSPCLTLSRPVSPCLTLSHHVSPCLTISHPVYACHFATDYSNSTLSHTLRHVWPSSILRITSVFFSNVTDIRHILATVSHSLGFTALLTRHGDSYFSNLINLVPERWDMWHAW